MDAEGLFSLPATWKLVPLLDCTSDKIISYGIVQPGSHIDDGIPIIRVNNFGRGNLDLSTVLKVAPEIEEKFSRTRLAGGEVLLTLVGSTGQSIVAPKRIAGWNVPRAVAVIRVNDEVGAEWVNLCLQTDFTRHFLDSRANTTVQKTLNLADVKKIPIPIPPKKDKDFIEANILSLDKKIQLNRQINQTLEQMAQALFKSWFVDFDPVIDNAIDAGNPIPEPLLEKAAARKAQHQQAANQPPNDSAKPTTAGLPKDLRALFPSEFEHTEELGWVPKGWETITFEECCASKQGKYIPKNEMAEFECLEFSYPVWGGNGVRGFATKCTNNHPVVVLTCRGSNCGLVEKTEAAAWISNISFACEPNLGSVNFLFTLFKNMDFSDCITGSAQPQITYAALKSKKIPFAINKDIVDTFSNLIDTKYLLVSKNRFVAQSLTQLRDTLLPKLISGELRILDAEQAVEALS